MKFGHRGKNAVLGFSESCRVGEMKGGGLLYVLPLLPVRVLREASSGYRLAVYQVRSLFAGRQERMP